MCQCFYVVMHLYEVELFSPFFLVEIFPLYIDCEVKIFSLFQIYLLCFQEAAMTSGGLGVQGLDRWDLIQAFFFPNHPICFRYVSKTFRIYPTRFHNESDSIQNVYIIFLEHIQNIFQRYLIFVLFIVISPSVASPACSACSEQRGEATPSSFPNPPRRSVLLPYAYLLTINTPVHRL